jgi:Raf kinase inhibitor-like YbhB/YbcL family protein
MKLTGYIVGTLLLTMLTACGSDDKNSPASSSSSSVALSSIAPSSIAPSSTPPSSTPLSSVAPSSMDASSSVASSSSALFTLTSTGFGEGDTIPAKFSCDGIDVNPQLAWTNPPEGTQSFAIIVDDPDALAAFGLIWVHWNAYNIPADISAIAEGASSHVADMPLGSVEGTSDFGSAKYRGPCPPSGRHQYHFAVYALSAATITMTTPSTRGEFETDHAADILQKAEVTAYFR